PDRAEPNSIIEFAQYLFADFFLRRTRAFYFSFDAPTGPVGFDNAWMDAIHAHAVGLATIGKTFGEGGNRGVDRTANREFCGRLASAGAADRNERTAPRLQQRPGGAGEPHMGEEFQRVAILPVGVGQSQKIAALGGACI